MASSGVRDSDSTENRLRRLALFRNDDYVSSLKPFEEIATLTGGNPPDSGEGSPDGNYMKRDGDEWLNSFGNEFDIGTIDGGFVNVSKNTGLGRRLTILNPEGGLDDFLDTLNVFPTEFVYLEKYIQIANNTVTLREPITLTITNIVGNDIDDIITVTVSDITDLADDDFVIVTAPGNFSSNGWVKIFNVTASTFQFNLGEIGSTTPQTSGSVQRGNLKLPDSLPFEAIAGTFIHFIFDTASQVWTLDYASNGIGGGSSNVPDPTAEFQHLQSDGANNWIAQQELQFGVNSADAGQIRIPNNVIGLAWSNLLNDGNIELKVNASDILDITNSANDPVILSLRAQDASFSDISSSWTQLPNVGGLGGTTTFTYPTELAINHGATLIALFDSTDEINFFKDVDFNKNALILNPDTDTVIAAFTNSIQFFVDNLSRVVLSDTELLMGVNINANDNDIVGIKNLDFDDALSTIFGLVDLQWFQGGHQFTSVSGEFNYRVDTSDVHNFFTGATKVITISDGALNVNNNVINTIKELQFDITNTFIPVTVGIGFNVTGVMIYTVPLVTHFHDFRINDESMFTISRFGLNQGQIQTSIITATDFLIAEEILDFATFDNTSPSNGNIWLNLSGLFQFRQNGVTVGLGGGGGSPLTTKGDIFTFDTADARLPVGTNGQVLTANSAVSLGVEWATPTGGGANTALSNLASVSINTSLLPSGDGTINLGSAANSWLDTFTERLRIETGGASTSTANQIIADGGGMIFNTPAGDRYEFNISGSPNGIAIEEDRIEFLTSGRQHRIDATGSSINILSENISDSVEIWTGTGRTNVTIDINSAATTFLTQTSDVQAVLIQLIQNNNTPFNFRTIANIDFMAENSVSSNEIYARVSASSQNVTSGIENGLLQLGVVSGGVLISGIDIEGSGSGGVNDALIGFFGEPPVVQQQLDSNPSNTEISTALRNLGLAHL